MESTATARFARIAPRKARTVVNLVRGRKVSEAINLLMFTRKSAAPIVRKVIESALANAKHSDATVDIDGLYVSVCQVDKGPNKNARRWRPRAQGRATRVTKGISHIAITLTDQPPPSKKKNAPKQAEATETAPAEAGAQG
ncbi:MAG: 50S ribosomal protein L22 [Myxococcales bacterium]|nr:50S ribosomal protein L22 [Myxococcales bacterium]